MNWLENQMLDLAVKILTPILIGFAVPFCVDALKRAVGFIDRSPAYVKQGIAVAVAAGATALTHAFGVPVPTDLALWDAEVVKVLLAAAIGVAVKQAKQLKKGA